MYKIVQEADLCQQYSNWNLELALEHPDALKKVLWQQGIDLRFPIETQEGLRHRNYKNEIVETIRWVGVERTDADWRNSGRMSIEALYSESDSSLRDDLRSLDASNSYRAIDLEEVAASVVLVSEKQ